MKLEELIPMAWTNLWRIKLRTILTIGGVVIGITAMITMVSIGIGLERSITGELSALTQMNVLEVRPAGALGIPGLGDPDKKLDQQALRDFASLEGVVTVSPVVTVYNANLHFRRDHAVVTLVGMDFRQLERFGYVLEGREGIPRLRNAVLAGCRVPEILAAGDDGWLPVTAGEQGRADLERRQVELRLQRGAAHGEAGEEVSRSYRLRVVGILEETGGMEDYSLVVPLDLAEEIFEWQQGRRAYFREEGYPEVRIIVENAADINRVQGEIEEMGYFVFSMQMILQSISTVFLVLQVFLGAIGGIALLVASLGIVNTLIMSIYERTREIGIIKVIGASLGDVRNLFLLEAALIGFLGGLIGVLAGWLIGRTLNFLANLYFTAMGAAEPVSLVALPLWLVLGGIVFAVLVGVAAGLYPAVKASRLSPIEAIRYE